MKYSPREFMKMRRPERFSDTVIAKKGNLNRSILEYKLEVLTSNSQEQEFQKFSFKLAQLEIAPNLRPQTGPSGGGDSKADSETYPVSDFTRFNFWEGIANESGERWAFAISAKKEWVGKVTKDVKGIVDTSRDYKRIFFITNQFAKDKKRAEIEDKLSQEHSIPITILDRTWILDRVFKNNREKLAIEELHLAEGLEDEITVGPNDVERMKLFEQMNGEIETALSKAVINYKVVDKALDTALLARGMGKSRTDVDGLFNRAISLAQHTGSEEQVYSVIYEKAWTTFFWFEDFEKFVQLYDELESIAETSVNIYTLQRQHNLGGLLRASQEEDSLSAEYVYKKLANLKKLLAEFAQDDTKPSATHQARMLLALGDLFDNAAVRKDLNQNFKEIRVILQGTERLIGFPYEESVGLIQENGDVFGDIPEYEKLINLIAEIDARRKGEIPAAKSLLKYGIQHLEAGRHYKAIEYIGRSLVGLYKKESKDDFIHALYFIAYGYEAAGLLWAARGSLLHAASYTVSDLRQRQEVYELQGKCCRRLKMNELRLGRVGYVLEWHQADLVLSSQMAITQEQREAIYEDSLGNFSSILGCLLLKTRPTDLPKLEKAPDLFDRLSIDFSGLALLYLLGGETYLPDDYWKYIENQSSTDFFNRWLNQPAQKDLPAYPDYYINETVRLESNILGTHFTFETKNGSPGIEICEMIVAALEAYLSTAIVMEMYGKVSHFKVIAEEHPELTRHVQLANEPVNGRHLKVLYKPFNPHLLSVEVQHEISEAVSEIILRIISETIAFSDHEKSLKELVVDQRVDERSFNFLSPLVMLGNVLGHNPKRSIAQWVDEKDTRYPFDGIAPRLELLSTNYRHGKPTLQEKSDSNDDDFFDIKKHQNLKTFSVINEHLWQGQVWRGFAFAVDLNVHAIHSPTLYLMFDNRQTAIDIFKEWKERFGDKAGEEIQLSILKGIDTSNPNWYKGLIGSNIKKEEMKNGNRVISMTKISTMTPTNPGNLEGFLKSYSRFGYYTLAPFFIDLTTGKPEALNEWGFVMKELSVKYAWEVSVNDMEMTAIAATDDPIIPNEITNAPVLEVLKMKRKRDASSA
jgi:hypothetical protein